MYKCSQYGRISVCGSLSTVSQWMGLFAPEKDFSEFKNSKGTYQGYVDSKELVSYFERRWGLIGPKCEDLPWPEDLPSELLVHFMRGLWDSDGSLSIYDRRAHGRAGNPELKARFGVKDSMFVERVRGELERELGVERVVNSLDGGIWRISYAGAPAMKIADWIYGRGSTPVNEARMELYRQMCAVRAKVSDYMCVCGSGVHYKDGLCRRCWWVEHQKHAPPKPLCPACGQFAISTKGLCGICYKRAKRKALKEGVGSAV